VKGPQLYLVCAQKLHLDTLLHGDAQCGMTFMVGAPVPFSSPLKALLQNTHRRGAAPAWKTPGCPLPLWLLATSEFSSRVLQSF